MTKLEPISAEEAVELYLQSAEGEKAASTVQSHEYRLQHFIRWCDKEGRDNLNELSGRDLQAYRVWRRKDGNLTTVSLRGQLATIRAFLKFCERIDGVPHRLHEKVELPDAGDGEHRDTIMEAKRAEKILEHLSQFKYASREHALFLLLWRTGIRVGAARGIDVKDVHRQRDRVELIHRPETDTPLKNAKHGERYVTLTSHTSKVLADYIDNSRHSVTDDYERQPLFTTAHGRPTISTLRRTVYRVTQPCFLGECPHDREPEECDAEGYKGGATCPSSIRPHDIRRGAITHFLLNDVPEQVVSDRMNVSKEILDKHYDKRTEEQKAEQRRGFLNNL
ncbi:tyrosine-type recombinase/integrase [Haloprofundus salilacus]|uniref:tyrosine-type recombinase/integrase n=1 Tax=Haloprofundus salilacus TaxID=2876190 RepID=UPI001CCA33A5|nr:tyrosine-type recombinase/integrase [Haloprofundus salilacus]